MTIAIPTGVKIFNWLGTMALGQVRFTTPMMFAVGMVSMFTIGGISGVMHATAPIDAHHNDSYFLIAHFHYVLFGGSMFGLIAGIYYWFPKISGRMMSETLGKLNFWTVFVGFNATFFPMHFLGLEGMPRRYYTYGEGAGWNFWNLVVTIGAYILGLGMLMLLYNVGNTLRRGKRVGANPWDAPTLEWATTSPPPVYNFAEQPMVASRDPLWAEKYGHTGDAPAYIESEEIVFAKDAGDKIRLPNPSFWPLFTALGILFLNAGFLFDTITLFYLGPLAITIVSLTGLIMVLWGVFAWAFEPTGVEGLH